jgi:hypothetical protein
MQHKRKMKGDLRFHLHLLTIVEEAVAIIMVVEVVVIITQIIISLAQAICTPLQQMLILQ